MQIYVFSAYLCTLQSFYIFVFLHVDITTHIQANRLKHFEELLDYFFYNSYLQEHLLHQLVNWWSLQVFPLLHQPSFGNFSNIKGFLFVKVYLCGVSKTSSAISLKKICIHFPSTCNHRSKPAILLKVNLDHWFFLPLLHYIHDTKTRKASHTLHKNRSFPLKISPVNVTRSAGNCGFGHIY